ncbi:MAG: type VI secretion system protein TssA [Gemmatirosa sp.]
MPINAALVEALLTAVPGDSPAGRDLRYDPRYDKVKEARREDMELPAGGLATERKLADWPQVIALASQLLETETKDLQLAAWLSEALLKRDGLGGLATGLGVLKGVLDKYWDGCYPELDEEDLELRTGPLEWVGSRLDVPTKMIAVATDGLQFLEYQVSRGIPTEHEADGNGDRTEARREAIDQGKRMPEDADRAVNATNKAFYKALVADAKLAQSALDALEITADQRFGRDAPAFNKLRGALEDIDRMASTTLAIKLEADPDPIEEAPLGAEDVGAYTPPEGWTGEGGAMPAEPVSAADAAARVAAAARYLRKQDPSNPAPYLMLRGLRWGELLGTPGEVEPKLLEAPATATRAKLKTLFLDGRWADLLEQGESLMAVPQGRGWLDLQRYALTACAQLGGTYAAVGAAIRGELRALLTALPRLPEMTLMDDTPTANDATRAWLEAEGLDGAGEDVAASADIEFGDGSEALDDALAQDDETAEHGGLARASGRRRPRVAAPGGVAPRDPFTQARAELTANRPNRAIELLVAELARERSARGRFVRQTQIAWVMVEANLAPVARPILEKLVAEIDERQLENWEAGPLVAQPMALLCRVIDKLEDSYAADQRSELYLRVCRLDPLQAIALQRGA